MQCIERLLNFLAFQTTALPPNTSPYSQTSHSLMTLLSCAKYKNCSNTNTMTVPQESTEPITTVSRNAVTITNTISSLVESMDLVDHKTTPPIIDRTTMSITQIEQLNNNKATSQFQEIFDVEKLRTNTLDTTIDSSVVSDKLKVVTASLSKINDSEQEISTERSSYSPFTWSNMTSSFLLATLSNVTKTNISDISFVTSYTSNLSNVTSSYYIHWFNNTLTPGLNESVTFTADSTSSFQKNETVLASVEFQSKIIIRNRFFNLVNFCSNKLLRLNANFAYRSRLL